jgi:hypothetical protein
VQCKASPNLNLSKQFSRRNQFWVDPFSVFQDLRPIFQKNKQIVWLKEWRAQAFVPIRMQIMHSLSQSFSLCIIRSQELVLLKCGSWQKKRMKTGNGRFSDSLSNEKIYYSLHWLFFQLFFSCEKCIANKPSLKKKCIYYIYVQINLCSNKFMFK